MKNIFISIRILVFMTILTGVVYPLLVTVAGQTLFPHQAGGGIVTVDGQPRGAALIAQNFETPRYFWPRPSAVAYTSASSGASNLGPISEDLKKVVDERRAKLKAAHPTQGEPPQDLIFASGSGLDPHISPAAAAYQLDRVAGARAMNRDAVRVLIDEATQGRQFGTLGEPRVDVLKLNLALDRAQR